MLLMRETLKIGDMTFKRHNPSLVLKWINKKEIYRITTTNDYSMIDTKKTGYSKELPEIKPAGTTDYNMARMDHTVILLFPEHVFNELTCSFV